MTEPTGQPASTGPVAAPAAPTTAPPTAAPAAPAAPRPGSANPEALDQIIETTKPRGWLALWAIAAAVVIALIWSLVATIPQQVSATGVVSAFAYTVDVTAPIEGVIDFEQDVARVVKEGEEVATITPYDGSAPVSVTATVSGQLQGIFVNDGEGVEPGTELSTIVRSPDPSEGIAVVTYVPAAQAINYDVGETAQITVTNLSTSVTKIVTGEITNVANSPSSLTGMTNMTGSVSLSEQWMTECDGAPFRIYLKITDWPTDDPKALPAPGQVVSIVNTYGYVHPIQLLFGGN